MARTVRFTAQLTSWWIFLILGYSSAIHATFPFEFAESIMRYRIVGAELGILIASFVPLLIMALIIAVLHPEHRLVAHLWAAGFGLVFVGIQITSLLRGLDISCGCFGIDTHRISWFGLWLPGSLVIAGAVGATVLWRASDEHAATRI